jgi:CheY-like chemotaxis protein
MARRFPAAADRPDRISNTIPATAPNLGIPANGRLGRFVEATDDYWNLGSRGCCTARCRGILANPMNGLSILVVDDHEEIRSLLRLWLKSRSNRVTCAASGNKALKMAKKCRFDLVITDVMMPDGGGVELISRLKEAHSEVRILAISGGGAQATGQTCLQYAHGVGAHGLLFKPFKGEQLLDAIRHIMQACPKLSALVAGTSTALPTQPEYAPSQGANSPRRAALVASENLSANRIP